MLKNTIAALGIEAIVMVEGEEAFLKHVTDRVIEGESLKEIAETMGFTTSGIQKWIWGSRPRVTEYQAALRLRADSLAHESLHAVEIATPEDVQVRKLQAEHKLRMAGKWDPATYEPRVAGRDVASGGVTVIVNRDSAMEIEAPDGAILSIPSVRSAHDAV